MRQVFGWVAVLALCFASGAAAGEQEPDAQLQEAQAGENRAVELYQQGKLPEAVAQYERVLKLREAVLGGMHPVIADTLGNLALLYKEQGLYSQAEPLYQRALAIQEAALGKNHPDVAASLTILAALYHEQGLYDRAEPLFERARAVREAAFGKNHPLVAESLHNLGYFYETQGLYGRAEPLYQRALAIREATLGKNHPHLADSLTNLANLYKEQGLYSRAEPLYQRALAIREAAFGKNHPTVADSLSNLANLYMARGLYGQAEPLYQRALAIREAALGKHHPDVAGSLNNLANLYMYKGLYSRAEPLFERALVIYEAALGKHHPDLATLLNNLANLYMYKGLYGRAEPLLERSLAIREAALGKHHPSVADSLNNLAILYKEQGLYGRAVPLHKQALAIREAALGKHHHSVADSLNNLAVLYKKQEQYGQAELLYQQAFAIQEAALGKHHPALAAPLNNLAILYEEQGLYGRAEPLHKRALAIREAALGKNHPDVAESLHNLATLYDEQGLHSRAERLLERSLAIREAALGKNHPILAESLNNLAMVHLAQHRLGTAVPLFTRAFTLSEKRLRQEALDFSEERLASFLRLLRTDEERLYSLLRAHPDNASVRRLVLSAALLLKGRSAEETADISRAIYRSLGPEERNTFERLRELRTQLSKLSLEGPGSLSPATYQHRLEELAGQGDELEALLAKRSAPLRALTALPSPADIVDRVSKALPKDSALVEFITYVDSPWVSDSDTPEAQRRGQLRYLALVLLPDASIRVRDLGPAEPIDLAASRLRDALANRDAAFQVRAQALYSLAFQPLLPLVGGIRRLFLSPDGQLSLVPFAALHDGSRFLVDTFDFSYVTSGKDLLPRSQETSPAASVVVLADPDFSTLLPALAASSAEASARAERSTALAPLPGTREEAKAIQRLLPQAQLFLGAEATKERLLQLPTPGILHLATHGFFLEDAAVSPRSRAVGHFGAMGEEPLPARLPDPLLRSGLLFAGTSARTPSTSDLSQFPPDSALVTALELAGLNLWGTQLVVLSACDTGRGAVKLGQGVYGMRRALMVAGAETVVTSLWKVNDETTRTLMETYYRHLLAGQGRAAALREAMRSLRATQPHPHYWAPFIALGQDAPLRAMVPR